MDSKKKKKTLPKQIIEEFDQDREALLWEDGQRGASAYYL